MSKNNILGATLIVAGTTIGAGMLALPIASMATSFAGSTLMLGNIWVIMCITALITLELNLFFGRGISIAGLASKTLGKGGQVASSFAILMLFYSLLAAYITGGSSIIDKATKSAIPLQWVAIAFTLFFGFFVNRCIKSVDYINRIMFITKLGAFFAIISLLIPEANSANLIRSTGDISSLWLAAPIFFTSFGFHGSLPSLINYLGAKRNQIRFAIIIGSLIPLIVYIIWQAATLGTIDAETAAKIAEQKDLGLFIEHLSRVTGNGSLHWLINIFAFLAITTSFLGVAIGLFDFLAERLKLGNSVPERFKTSLLTFVPPLFFALCYPQGFIMALGYSSIALVFLAIFIPVAVAVKLSAEGFRTSTIGLVIISTCGIIILAAEANLQHIFS